MGKISYLNLPPGYDTLYAKALAPGDRFTFSRTRVKSQFLSRTRVKGISVRSLLNSLAPVWAALTTMEKAAWTAAGAASGMSGWKMFVADTAARRRAGVAGYATPNTTYQAMVGRITVAGPATGLQIEQAHPLTYYVQRKVAHTRSQYSPVAIGEPFTLPLSIAISWHSDLTAIDGSAYARFFARVFTSYQGRTLETDLIIPFGMADAWQRSSATLSAVRGVLQGYSAFVEVYNATGSLYFDNVELTHDSENWARDAICNNISQEFTRAFQQVAKHWAPTNLADGAEFASFYFVP